MLAIRLVAFALSAPLASLGAQRSLYVQYGTELLGELGRLVRDAGDIDRDGADDFLVTQPAMNSAQRIGRVFLVSGRTRATLHTFVHPQPDQRFGEEAIGLTDVNGDGVRDLAITRGGGGQLDVFSGATGVRLASLGQLGGRLADVGDVDRDGRGDIAGLVYAGNNTYQVWIVRGTTGQQLAVLPEPTSRFFQPQSELLPAGDLTGDGITELVITSPVFSGQPAYVFDLAGPRVLRALDVPNRSAGFGAHLAAGEFDGDGVRDILIGEPDRDLAHLFSGRTGVRLRTYSVNDSDGHVASLGDLNGDGFGDLALDGGDYLHLLSGASGAALVAWRFGRTPGVFAPATMAGIGDVDGDGAGEVVIGDPSTGALQQAGAFEVLSTRILAETTAVGGACGGGPFPVQLGLTRAILGQTATVVCRDGPAGAAGLLLFSLAPAAPIYLGASTCSAWLDPATLTSLFSTGASQWNLPLPIPGIAPLAGIQFALQVIYGPTAGPLGFDLSNGVLVRCGY